MERLSPAILEAFGVHSRKTKKEKGHYLCDTAKGLVKIHTTYESVEAVCLQHSIKEHLAAEGFPWTDRFQLTKGGQPYMLIGRETYIATLHPNKQHETDFENEADVLQAFEALARFHIASSQMPQKKIISSPPLPDIYARQMNELTQARKQARRGSRMSDFDVSFIKHAPDTGEIIKTAIDRLAKTNYIQLHNAAINQGSLCHNALKEENLLTTGSTTYITNFSNATIDLQLSDLGALIRRYAQRSSKSIAVGNLLEAYDKISPLPSQANHILYAQLIFPWAFMKLVTQYYSKKRNWTPNGLHNRMETLLAERESYEKYIESCIK